MNSEKRKSLFSDNKNIRALLEISHELNDIKRAMDVLSWDRATYMPPGGIEGRAYQISTLAGIHHERLTRKAYIAIRSAKEGLSGFNGNKYDIVLIKQLWRELKQAKKLPSEFVMKEAEISSRGYKIWEEARKTSSFKLFFPVLEEIVNLMRQKADYLGYDESPYDALLDLFEPDLTTREASNVFDQVKVITKDILAKIGKSKISIDREFLKGDINIEKQQKFSEEVLKAMGFNFNHGRQDISVHPFCTTFHPHDVRITTRFGEEFFTFPLFSTIHEGGHALYDQNIDERLARTVLCEGTSLGIHESQSRFWENYVGRSGAFWVFWYPKLKKIFKERLAGINVNDFWRAINAVKPGFIRVDADEVTYNLHVLLRFEIERDLIEGKIQVKDLPDIWNAKMKEYLGIEPPNDALGVLQNVHWSECLFGYFPTYTLGNLYAAQIYHTLWDKTFDFDTFVAEGKFDFIKEFMTENICRYGKTFKPAELIERSTGEPLDVKYFKEYLEAKFSRIYKW